MSEDVARQKTNITNGVEDLKEAQQLSTAIGEKMEESLGELGLAKNALAVAIEQFRKAHTGFNETVQICNDLASKTRQAGTSFLAADAANSSNPIVQEMAGQFSGSAASIDKFNNNVLKYTVTKIEEYLHYSNAVHRGVNEIIPQIAVNITNIQALDNSGRIEVFEHWRDSF